MKKISIIVPCYGTEKYVSRCLDSLINQTYQNIEIITVNDCSKGNMLEILASYAKKDNRIKVVDNKQNQGLFKTRCIGSQSCTGDFISFVDSDDYVDIDYFRLLAYSQKINNSDIVVAEFIRATDKVKYLQNYMKMNKEVLDGKECLNEYFNQEGKNYRWHTLCNKLINIKLWKKALPYYLKQTENLVMTEDFSFSSILMLFCNKLSFVENALYFYCQNDNQSTSMNKMTYNRIFKGVHDIDLSFTFVKNVMIEINIFDEYKERFNHWKSMYIQMWRNYTNKSKQISSKERKELLDIIDGVDNSYIDNNYPDMDSFYSMASKWNPNLNKLKEAIVDSKIDIISFDIFDTLIQRPFYVASDLFYLLNDKFNKKFNNLGITNFSKLRINAEQECRDELDLEKREEITLDQIYAKIAHNYDLDITKLNTIKDEEIKLEINFCTRRETAYQLYLMALQVGKKIICTSDMYLPESVIEKILIKNGYDKVSHLYLSCTIGKTKGTSHLYENVIDQEKNNNILHIGDNWHSDVEMARKSGLKAYFFPKALSVFMNEYNENITNYCGRCFQNFELYNQDLAVYLEMYGPRCSMAIVANKFFDNPFITFNSESDFNGDAYFIGYYLLGMHLLSLSNWLLNDTRTKKNDSLSFMARDGYLPLKATEILQKNTNVNKKIKLKYVYVSRKALMPLLMNNLLDFYAIDTYLDFDYITPRDLLQQLSSILELPSNYEDIVKDYNLDKKFKYKNDFNDFLKLVFDNFYSKAKYNNLIKIAQDYFNPIYEGKAATFDVGYSGKPEVILSNLLGKPISTYFIHINNSSGFNNSVLGDFSLQTFYSFKPTYTGTFRELLISDIGPSCVGYKRDNKGNASPIFSKQKEYTYFNKYMISQIQDGALKFVDDFSTIFKDYIENIDLNRYYMSIPYEYYLNYSKPNDRQIFDGLVFDGNVGVKVDLNDFFINRRREYNSYCNKNNTKTLEMMNPLKAMAYALPRTRIGRIKYYILHDRKMLVKKIKDKLNIDLK